MIIGIGIDAADIEEINRTIQEEGINGPFIRHTFTEQERREQKGNPAEYYAARFATKEAVFKAIAPNLKGQTERSGFDFRDIESSHHSDGSPYIILNDETKVLIKQAGGTELLLTITTEGNLAIAFVILQ